MSQNMYRVGDCVYFEDSNAGPYNIRRIEELTKNAAGNVEARVVVFYRRRDISSALLKIADQAERHFEGFTEDGNDDVEGSRNSVHTVAASNGGKEPEHSAMDVDQPEDETKFDWGIAGLPAGAENLSTEQRFRLRLRELFLSRQMETLPATQIRGKCSVTLLSEIETPDSYQREDAYFYSLVYDPSQMSLLADKGAIRVGDKYQASVPDDSTEDTKMETEEAKENGGLMIDEEEETDDKKKVFDETEREVLVYHPHHELTEREIDQFLIIARSVGTFSRALDTSSSTKLPSLHMTAAAASRDVTIFHAMALLHQAGYDLAEGMKYLVPPPNKEHYPLDVDKGVGHNTISLGGPILIRDQIEEWSAAEANLFEEALEKYGKDFSDIRNDYLPWKAMRDIVEYYYMWKTTNRYIDGRKKKMHEEKEAKLKQVYIPNHNKPCANLIGTLNTTSNQVAGTSPCEGCKCTEALNWYAWGPAQLQLRLCQSCWASWKKAGGLSIKHEYDRYDILGCADSSSSESKTLTMSNPLSINKTSAAAQNRVASSGQVIARLPPNHPQFVASSSSNAANPVQRTVPFLLKTNAYSKIVRKNTPKNILNLRKHARSPGSPINFQTIHRYLYSPEFVRSATSANTTVPEGFLQMLQRMAASKLLPNSNSKASASLTPLTSKTVNQSDYHAFRFMTDAKFRKSRHNHLEANLVRKVCRLPCKNHPVLSEKLSNILLSSVSSSILKPTV